MQLCSSLSILWHCLDFPGGSDGKASCLQCGRPGFSPWVGKILWRRKWQPTLVLFPGKSHGQRSVVGYSPWGRKESDTTERLHFHFTIARTWKQPICPSADKWIKMLWYIYTMEYYSAIKKNAFESVLMRWMKPEPTKQS